MDFKLAFEDPFTFQRETSGADIRNEVGGQEQVFWIRAAQTL